MLRPWSTHNEPAQPLDGRLVTLRLTAGAVLGAGLLAAFDALGSAPYALGLGIALGLALAVLWGDDGHV